MRPGAFVLLLATACASACASGRSKGGLLEPIAPEGVTQTRAEPRRLALLVGVDAFEDARFGPLRYAGLDAEKMGQTLERFDWIRVLSRPESTSRAAVLSALAELAAEVSHPRDTVVLYLSTHGTLARRPGGELERFIVLRDTRLDQVSATGISVDQLLAELDRLVSRRTALILATCHSGRGKSALSDPLARALARSKGPRVELPDVSEATIVVTAAAHGEAAEERDELGHDVYTHFLLEGMRRGDADEDGQVSLSEAHDYARERTYVFSEGLQRPTAETHVLGRDPIILTGRATRAPRPVLYGYSAAAEGVAVEVNGRLKGVLPGSVALSPGDQHVVLRAGPAGAALAETSLSVAAGERLDLVDILPAPLVVSLAPTVIGLASTSERLPTTVRAGGRATVARGAWAAGASLGWERGAGVVAGRGGPIDYTLEGFTVGVHGGWSWVLDADARWALDLRGEASVSALSRALSRGEGGAGDATRYEAEQSLRGLGLALAPALRFSPVGPLVVSAGPRLEFLWGRFDGAVEVAPRLGAELSVGLNL